METARRRTREPRLAEATMWKGGEFRKSERKRRKKEKKKEDGKVQKKEMVENVEREGRKPH